MTTSTNIAIKKSPDIVYEGALLFWRTVTNIFFREVRPRGAFNIPRDGPVIFVAAPHHNQARHLARAKLNKCTDVLLLVFGPSTASPRSAQGNSTESAVLDSCKVYETEGCWILCWLDVEQCV